MQAVTACSKQIQWCGGNSSLLLLMDVLFCPQIACLITLLQALTAYKHHLRDAVSNLGATSTAADRFSDETFHFEKRIAEITPSLADLQDPTRATIVTVKMLKILAPSVSSL
jgi:hypothetical protein